VKTARLQKKIEALVLYEQSGFRKGRSRADIFILKQLIKSTDSLIMNFIS
jgi:hypothetical protein